MTLSKKGLKLMPAEPDKPESIEDLIRKLVKRYQAQTGRRILIRAHLSWG